MPFIDVVYPSGQLALLSLAGVLEEAERVRLATTDPLLWAATARLLTAVAYTAGCGPLGQEEYAQRIRDGIDLTAAKCWVDDHADDLDIFHPVKPLFQDGSLHAAAATLPDAGIEVLYLDFTAAIRRPLLSDHRHLHTSVPVSAAHAAGLLLVQQMWCPGGRISAREAVYGKGCNHGRRSFASGGLVIQPDGTVAQMLAWRLMPLPKAALGNARWTYRPRPEPSTARDMAEEIPDGETDALTWQPRRVLLLPQADGTVARAMFAQGWTGGRQVDPVTGNPGCRDLLTTPSGSRLPADVVTSEEDIAPLVHSWWTAPPSSWAHTARKTADTAGFAPPDVRVTGATSHYKKIDCTRHVFLPGTLLANPRGKDAAACVLEARSRSTTAAPGIGSVRLLEEEFMRATDEERTRLLDRTYEPVCGPDPEPDLDETLFTTADTPPEARHDEADPDPVGILIRKLGGWALSPHTRGLMTNLASWAAAPSVTNPACSPVTRLLPDDLHQPGMMTAALFAVHRKTSQAGSSPYGKAPLARLMRAFGTGYDRGPLHQPTRAAMTVILRARRTEDLLPLLLRQIRYAATQGLTPNWGSLMHDLAHWGPATQERWQQQFYTRTALPAHDRQTTTTVEGQDAA
ncbi:type I-E CRISPR-associated protein Cse1/CasA [Streptomyces sp. NBC_01433]|uniref:type I-E CRISPR-associated protein Cse2/CasB n=1 Tax=Streptomyces sp. NBC_01433 TaxID=2903864 RepID=UPI00224E8BC2|nr:type I-E CRISPR-associated protein Cse2/CasB [Streptomyces sp. NBC_01433]MCX4682195.1 type I-E CRISPR-associated protein Cse1/CasA [Streptomyces sp. NBC_01433]